MSVLKRDVMMRLRGTRKLRATDDERFDEPARISENEENMHSEKICTFLFLLQERRVTEQLGAAKLMH